MPRTILLVSRDDELQFNRAKLMQEAGYRAFCVDSIPGALLMTGAERPHIALLCSTFRLDEQEAFIERVRETNTSLFVLCIRDGDVSPAELIEACNLSFRKQPGMSNVRILDGGQAPHSPVTAEKN
jgi:DNA-binding response OmpR family regulator